MRHRLHAAAAIAGTLAAAAAPAALGQSAQPAVFVANNVSDQISVYTMNADGTVVRGFIVPTSDGPQTIALSPDGRLLSVGHGTANSVTEILQVFEVMPDGSLILVDATNVPDSPLGSTWIAGRVLAVTETDTGGSNFVHAYRVDPGLPSISEIDVESTGAFNTSLAKHPLLEVLYAQDSTANLVRWFTVDAFGELDFGGSLGTGAYPLDLAITHGGAYLYAGGGISAGGHAVLGFAIDAKQGTLTALPGSPYVSPGTSPAYLAVSDDDAFLFVGHGTDATVHSMSIGPGGALAPTGFSFDVGLQGTIGDLAVLRGHLLVTDESTAIDGLSGLYSFAIQPDGSFPAAGPIVASGGVRPESIAAWDPPEKSVFGDLDGDGVVGIADLLILLGSWGSCPEGRLPCPGDLDGDGAVGIADLLLLLAAWT